jgi:hypothetical protein
MFWSKTLFVMQMPISSFCKKLNEISVIIFRLKQLLPTNITVTLLLMQTTLGGILILWNNQFTHISHIRTTHTISVILAKESGFTFAITSVYGPNNSNMKINFLREIRDIREQVSMPWVMVGDFNHIRAPNETTSNNINLGNMLKFDHMIQELEIQEILLGRKLTYYNGRPSLTFPKLDIVLWSHDLLGSNLISNLQDMSNVISDKIRRKFEETQRVIEEAWLSVRATPNITTTILHKLNSVRNSLRKWAGRKFRNQTNN